MILNRKSVRPANQSRQGTTVFGTGQAKTQRRFDAKPVRVRHCRTTVAGYTQDGIIWNKFPEIVLIDHYFSANWHVARLLHELTDYRDIGGGLQSYLYPLFPNV